MHNEFDERAEQQLIQIGINIATVRNIRKMSQETLAEKVGISSVEMSLIESPNVKNVFSVEVFFNIARALDVDAAKLISGNLQI